MPAKYRFGIDMGGTSAKLAVVDSSHRILWEANVPSAGFPKPGTLVDDIAELAVPILRTRRIQRVGVGVAGDIDFQRGVVRVSPNLDWKNVPLKKLFERRLGVPVVVDNDANVAGWGIYKTQVPATVRQVIVMTLGTGVGGGMIFNGELYRGATGSAGEVGHMIMNEHGRQCNCGNYGCLETYCGGMHITRMVKEALEKGQHSRLSEIYVVEPHRITPRAVAAAARAGDAYALSVWQQVGHMLGLAIGNLIYTYNPQMIVLTGGIAQAKNLILKPMWEALRIRAFKTPINSVKIKIAEQAPHTGVIGASLL